MEDDQQHELEVMQTEPLDGRSRSTSPPVVTRGPPSVDADDEPELDECDDRPKLLPKPPINPKSLLPGSEVDFIKRVLLGKNEMIKKFNARTLSCDQSNTLQQQRFTLSQRGNPRKRTSAPSQFGRTNSTRNILILRSRRSWPVAPQRMRR